MEFKDTKTYKNLQTAFAGESQARNKYTYFASQAKKEGYEKVAEVFLETADNEKEHAKLWFKEMNGGQVPGLAECLLMAAAGENEEWTEMYKKMAEEARAEGYNAIAAKFEGVAKIEKAHEERYRAILKDLEEGKVFEKEGEVFWKCRNCGHIHVGKKAPMVCPVCNHPQAYFEQIVK